MLVPAMADLQITSPSNPRLKAIVGLRRRRAREQSGQTVVEGFEELSLALDAGVVPEAVFHCAELMGDAGAGADLVQRARDLGAQAVEVSRTAFERTAYREGPDGILALVPAIGMPVADLVVPQDSVVLVCEGIEKPGNLGAMLRTADAAGVAAVDTVFPAIKNEAGLAAYAARARRDGFTGMMAIHPSQVASINAAFTPSADEAARAQAIVDAFAANPGVGVLQVDGKMVDAPHLKQAQHILSLAD